jgi:hypothetical protein
MNAPRDTWLAIRLLVLATFLVSGGRFGSQSHNEIPWIVLAISFVAAVGMLPLITYGRRLARLPISWHPASWTSNLLPADNRSDFFYLLAWCFIVFGVAGLAAAGMSRDVHWDVGPPVPAFPFIGGLGLLLSHRWSCRLFRTKII